MNDESPYTEFAIDCYQLWQAGAVYLPLVADVYGKAAGLLGGGRQDDGTVANAFTRLGSTIQADNVAVQGAIYPEYVTLRNDVTAVFSRISDRLNRVGEALTATAWAFAERDTENGNQTGSVTDQLEGQIGDRETQIESDNATGNPDALPEQPDEVSDPNLHDYDDQLLPGDDYPGGQIP